MIDKTPTYPEALDALFKDFLDGKTARVSANGLLVEGSMEGSCKLEYRKFWGLELSTPLKWNHTKVMEALRIAIFNKRVDIGLTYDNTDKLLPVLTEVVDNAYVRAGRINPYGVQSWTTTLYEDKLESVTIKYKNGNTIEIFNIQETK